MIAAVLEKQKCPLVLSKIDIQPLEVGQVLVEIRSSGICGAQIGEIEGRNGEDKYLPHLLGHEGAGIVIEVGQGVRTVTKGDHVVMHWRKGIGIEAEPAKYKRGNEIIGAGRVTTFSEQAVVSENRLTAIDKDIPFEIGALMGCAVTTAFGVVNNDAKLKIGQSIAVAGCGGVGLNIIQGAAIVAVDPIIAIDIHAQKLYMAEDFGATYTVDPTEDDFYEIIKDITKGDGVNVFVDCTGNPQVIEKGLECVADNGKLIMVGQPNHSEKLSFRNMRKHFRGITIMDSQGGSTNPTIDIPRYLNLYQQGKINLDDLITHKYPFEKINEAIETVKSGHAGRCILGMTK